MRDYQFMTATEAMRHAKEVSGMTAEDIAKAVGVRPSVIRRYLLYNEGYSPSLDRIPSLCRAMGNTVLLQWIEAQLEWDEDGVPPAQSRAQVLTAAARAAACLGDVQRSLADCEETGITPAKAREIRGLLIDVVEECRKAHGMLAELASHHDMRDTKPLASIRVDLPEQGKKRWWKFWARRD